MLTTPLGFRLAMPEMLALLALVPLFVLVAVRRARTGRPRVRYSSSAMLEGLPTTLRVRLVRLPFVLRVVAFVLLVVAASRPQFGFSTERQRTLGVDIVLAVDMSDSMASRDFQPNRLAAARAAMREFVAARPSDNIGIVGFGTVAAMLCPMTPDYRTVMQFIDLIDFRQLGPETAIGDAIMLSVKKLERSRARSKVLVLMTDGRNTAGRNDPEKAAEIAAALGIIIHTVGIGSDGSPMQRGGFAFASSQVADFDAALLDRLARMTGGRYHHATDNRKFTDVFREIDAMEKSRIELETSREYAERYPAFVWGALVLLVLDALLSATWLRRLP